MTYCYIIIKQNIFETLYYYFLDFKFSANTLNIHTPYLGSITTCKALLLTT